MARNIGTFNFPANFEVNKLGPLDARTVTPLACELTNSSLPFAYVGMIVSVTEDTSANNGVYMLSATDATSVDNWQRIGVGGSGGSGTVTGTTAGALLSTDDNSICPEFGINSGALDYLNQSACAGIDCIGTVIASDITGLTDCIGTVTGTTAGALLSTDDNSICPEFGINSGALDYLNQSACAGINCAGDICTVTTGPLLSGGGSSGEINIGINSGALDYLDQSTCAGLTTIGTVEGVTTSTLLSGGGNSGCFNIGIDSGALTYLDQSACTGLDKVGTVTCVTTIGDYLTGGGQTAFNIGLDSACAAKWDNASSGGVTNVTGSGGITSSGGNTPDISIDSACNTKWDQSTCTGLNKIGTVTGSTAGALLSTNGSTTCTQFGINSGALDYLNQSACVGIDCIGTIEGVTTTGDYLTGGGSTGCFNVGLDSACAAKWDNASSGGVTNVTGGDGISSSGGNTPEIAVDATVARTDVAEIFTNNVTVQGELSVSCAATLDGGVTIGNAQSIKLPSTAGTVYALDKVFTGVVGTGGTTIATFLKADLKSVKYDVTLVEGTNVTTFEVIAAYNGTAARGSVYAIADAQDDSQLDDVEITSTGTTIDLNITSVSNTTTATIFGKAKY